MRLLPEVCTDEAFLRRAYLDVVGLLPTPDGARAFLADSDPTKRPRLVDELLERKEFVEIWVNKWAELLQIRSSNRSATRRCSCTTTGCTTRSVGTCRWTRWSESCSQPPAARSRTRPTNYYQNETDTLNVAENVAQVFMGMRIQCAQCHNHPFDRWTQDDYYGFAASSPRSAARGAKTSARRSSSTPAAAR